MLVLIGVASVFFAVSNLATKDDLRSFSASTSSQYSQVDSRLTTIDSRIANSAQTIQQIDFQLQQIQNSVSGIENKLSSTNATMNNILIYSIVLAAFFSLSFNLAWKLVEHKVQVNNNFGGVVFGIVSVLAILVVLIILGIVRVII
ncbi:hypothetical protein AUJ65_00965 [Candidatus Micrarchaeota archaeon CG1_02_51_15]|nr:MAG: hypothetical protein AUJ65_00965 [Candidatus Micrarchaeota archaeon CG1_02_51_15]